MGDVGFVNSVISFATDALIAVEVLAFFAIMGVARVALRVYDVQFVLALLLMLAFACFSVPLDLCAAGFSHMCVENPCAPLVQNTGLFCPTKQSATCAAGTNDVLYAYKVLLALFVNTVLLLRASRLFQMTKKRIFAGLAISVCHVLALLPLLFYGSDVDLIKQSCRDLLFLQILQIIWSVAPAVLLVALELRVFATARLEARYYVQDEEKAERHDAEVEEIARALNLIGFELQTGVPRYAGAARSPEDLENALLTKQFEQPQQKRKRESIFLPLIAACAMLCVRVVNALYLYSFPSADWFDVFFNLLSLLTLSAYPLVISVTPFSQRPSCVADVLNSPVSLRFFREFLTQNSSPLYLESFKVILQLRVFALAEKTALQRRATKELGVLLKNLKIQNYTEPALLSDEAAAKVQKTLALALETAFLRFQNSPAASEMLLELRRTAKAETLIGLLKNKNERKLKRGVVGAGFIAGE